MKKSERINQELIFLNNRKSFNLADLMKEFNISKRTALRDIEALEALGLYLYVENGRYGGYRIINKNLLIPVYFDNAEITSIFFALKALTLLSFTPFEKSYDRIYEKLLVTLPLEQQKHILTLMEAVNYTSFPPVNTSNYLSTILESILNCHPLSISYTQYGQSERKILAYDLFYRNGIWFSNAMDIDTGNWGIYRCDCIEKCDIDLDTQVEFTRQELGKSLEKYEKTYHDIPFRCKLTPFGKEIFLKDNYPNMRLLENSNGEYFITGGFNMDELDYMVHYLIGMGDNVIIEYPEILKGSYLKQLNKIMKTYRKK